MAFEIGKLVRIDDPASIHHGKNGYINRMLDNGICEVDIIDDPGMFLAFGETLREIDEVAETSHENVEKVQWAWQREHDEHANGPFDSRDEAWADAARELGRDSKVGVLLGTCTYEMAGQHMPDADAVVEQFVDNVESSDEWSWIEGNAVDVFAMDLPTEARNELTNVLVAWADKYIGRSKAWYLENAILARTCYAPAIVVPEVQFSTANADFIAYLVGVLDTKNQRLLGAEIFSEPTPTLGSDRYAFTIASTTAKTYEAAKAKLETWINDDSSHVAWVRHIYRWIRDNRTGDSNDSNSAT